MPTAPFIVTSGLGQDSDILLQPTGNVGINVNSAVASLHVNHDLFLQGSNDPANTYTGMGLYMRFNTASNQGLIASGNNATSTPYPLTVQASQLNLGGGLSVGSAFASASPPSNGAIVQEQVGIATSSPLASPRRRHHVIQRRHPGQPARTRPFLESSWPTPAPVPPPLMV